MLTVHVISTVGWMGAIATFLALAMAGLSNHDGRIVNSAYVAMKLIGWQVIVPLGLASLLTGLVQSLGTTWGLFRHYWVIVKFVLTTVATGLLLLHMTLADRLADIADQPAFYGPRFHGPRTHNGRCRDAAAAIVLLIVNTVLSVFKPRGMTAYGLRKQWAQYQTAPAAAASVPDFDSPANVPMWVKVFGLSGVALLVLFRVVILHIAGGHGHHFH